MSSPVALTAIITLNPGAEQKFIELFNKCAEYSKENEPFVWTYELSRGRVDQKGEVTDLVIREVYENQALMEKHLAGAPVQELIKGIGEGLVKESKIIYTDYKPAVGFPSRL
ncbi:hypothetical protein JX265_009680 [Neoarthrinium moseri]|uniref:ABM domain-containing protein n=1 Tax=Neoarthrinium moseri TaxID=1658444 RepID=A0A9P9WFT5_9PEZI|nr:uncharacterized protein JN550_010917 [Neoarthrinium moseri]KAI1844056.1 hypothetical protein JX266_009729 [Neoarthrinium moseri]KAI1861061.1 hypothetical protein JX265_009680 [Neoarthrinium moseri]KAI1861387.1 hypothetical protein JN550_010917 [Neoarthrinium moseri]